MTATTLAERSEVESPRGKTTGTAKFSTTMVPSAKRTAVDHEIFSRLYAGHRSRRDVSLDAPDIAGGIRAGSTRAGRCRGSESRRAADAGVGGGERRAVAIAWASRGADRAAICWTESLRL